MPLYDYTCQDCDLTFEALVFAGDEVECPKCESEHVERQMSVPAKPQSSASSLPMNCTSDGPPCGAPWCRKV